MAGFPDIAFEFFDEGGLMPRANRTLDQDSWLTVGGLPFSMAQSLGLE